MASTLYFFIFVSILYEAVVGGYVRELTDYNFNNVVASQKMVVVSFYAHWCPHCQRFAPSYEAAAQILSRTHPSVMIAQIDCAGRGKSTCTRNRIPMYPTVRLFKNARYTKEFNGPRTESGVIEFVAKNSPFPSTPRRRVLVPSRIAPRIAPRPLQKPVPAPTRSAPRRVPKTQKIVVASLSWSMWSEWTKCSVTCGTGSITRSRSCGPSNSPSCPGSFMQEKTCRQKLCPGAVVVQKPKPKPVAASWNMWGEWSKCSVSCGSGSRTRSRVCGGPKSSDTCSGKSVEREACTSKPCVVKAVKPVVPKWGDWNEWTPCAVTCGNGKMTRKRVCSGSKCSGHDTEIGLCIRKPCSTDDQSVVAKTPVAAKKPLLTPVVAKKPSLTSVVVKKPVLIPVVAKKTTHTTVVAKKPSETPVVAKKPSQTPVVAKKPSPTPAVVKTQGAKKAGASWGKWSIWSKCSVTCGRGTITRSRVCEGSTPSDTCSGYKIETGVCIHRPCKKTVSS